jgi:uncharacterized protein YbjT (DUF2867 family)
MVATADVACAAAALLRESAPGHRIVELEGPARVSPDELAAALGRALGRPVVARAVPRSAWESRFRAQGMRNPEPRMRMLDGFNEGWIAFEGGAALQQRGRVTLDDAVGRVVASARAPAPAAAAS